MMLPPNIYIKSAGIDYSRLVGREVKIRTEQFPGKLLSARVVAFTEKNLVIDRSGSSGLINDLINHQPVEVSFEYKGEPVVFSSKICIPRQGRLQIPIASDVRPQVRRQFLRLEVPSNIRLTFFDDTNISSVRLSKLKWLETNAINISGGGILIGLPLFFPKDNYMILHIDLSEIIIPQLMVGRIRHKQKGDNNLTNVGVELVIREDCSEKLPNSLLRNLPLKLFDFDEKTRSGLASFLVDKYGNNIDKGKLYE
jgi:c-di-GMP-binding flagellar brake protein YcgR